MTPVYCLYPHFLLSPTGITLSCSTVESPWPWPRTHVMQWGMWTASVTTPLGTQSGVWFWTRTFVPSGQDSVPTALLRSRTLPAYLVWFEWTPENCIINDIIPQNCETLFSIFAGKLLVVSTNHNPNALYMWVLGLYVYHFTQRLHFLTLRGKMVDISLCLGRNWLHCCGICTHNNEKSVRMVAWC